MNLQSLGEFGLIDRISAQVAPMPQVICGIGDDAAVVQPRLGYQQLVTSDMLLEGVHFDLEYSDPRGLGRKSLAVNLSDIAAMGGDPRFFLLSLAVPSTLSLEFVDSLISGMLEIAGEQGVTLIGGDTCASKSGLVICITVIGEQLPDRVIRRSGALAGHLICVTGTLGDAALGLAELKSGKDESPAIERQLLPFPRCREGLLLAEAGIPSAMIDISDGLLADLGHILKQSGRGAVIELDSLPLSDYFRDHADRIVADPIQAAISGGEDYELLFTIDSKNLPQAERILEDTGVFCAVIGEITEAPGIQIMNPDGSSYKPSTRGFTHF